MEHRFYKLEIFVPEDYFAAVRQALWSVDAGHIGEYDRCPELEPSEQLLEAPGGGRTPFEGIPGELSQEQELKIEVCCRGERLRETLAAVKEAHPYEEPVINVLPLVGTGL